MIERWFLYLMSDGFEQVPQQQALNQAQQEGGQTNEGDSGATASSGSPGHVVS